MDYNDIAVFIEVVRCGSFSLAAKKLAMPNSTVSSKVSALERRLGTTLIQRTTRKLNVTPAGQAYFVKCQLGLEEIQSAELEIASIQAEPQGLLRVTAPSDLGGSVMPKLMTQYIHRFPKARIEVILTDRYVDLLSEGVDLAIRAGHLKDSTLISKKIGTVYLTLVASPRYLKSREAPKHPRELRSHVCLQFTPLGVDEWHLVGPKGSLNVALPARAMINDFSAVKRMALMGDGIALLPIYYCDDEVKRGGLVHVLPDWRTQLVPIHFVYPAQRFVTPKLSSFIELSLGVLQRSFAGLEL